MNIINKLLQYILNTILTFFGIGYIPFAPGTFGSLASIPLLLYLNSLHLNTIFHIILLSSGIIISSILIDKFQQKEQIHDPKFIVIDEILGMYCGWIFFQTNQAQFLIILFILFRFFDITKIWPANFFDKQKSASSVVLDDIIAGIYSGILLYIYKIFFI